MLSVLICETDETIRTRWTCVLSELLQKEFQDLRTELVPAAMNDLGRYIADTKAILLVILAVDGTAGGNSEEQLQLADAIYHNNRDSYIVLCVHGTERLAAILQRCMRPAGILLEPYRENDMRETLMRTLTDYKSLSCTDTDAYFVISGASGLQRIAFKDILYFEAADKLLNVCTQRNIFSVRMSMTEIEKKLPDMFRRCHRAYIVNCSCVEQVGENEIRLTTGERIPVSRSCRKPLKDRLAEVCV